MSSRHRPGSGRRYEELLDRSHSDDSALSALLDAARAPGTREDMAGLPAARTAFMSVPYVRTRPAASVSRLPAATRSAAGRLLALKFVAAVSGATLVGGAAYAATGAKLLGGSHGPPKHSTSSSAPAVPGHRGRGYQNPGVIQPTPGSQRPQAAPETTRDNQPANGALNGKSSAAHEVHNPPATPPGHSNTPGSPQTSHTPSPHHTPAPHSTKPHPSPNPHKSSPGRGDTNAPKR